MVPRITPDYAPHAEYETIVNEYLIGKQFHTSSSTYHDVSPPEIKDGLKRRYCPTSLYLRHRADRIAMHRERDIVFEYEIKTHSRRDSHNISIEALPLCHHYLKSIHFNVECLYVCYDPFINRTCGFWANSIPLFEKIFIPNRWDIEKRQWYKDIFRSTLPGDYQIIENVRVGGSGDPFLLIMEPMARLLPDWRSLIEERLK